ncbi:hypothetical protein Vau01_019510 [Virgisporangium aurantiacum]|uniref:Secreted protein n=2 Tax=Virgisporangium aurantiacum TaxID=175570 RepID=A0A8J3Z354_9ACTN|nr:hypothetical protein Vau01_019510 [Virgisporangium aurantiacum]
MTSAIFRRRHVRRTLVKTAVAAVSVAMTAGSVGAAHAAPSRRVGVKAASGSEAVKGVQRVGGVSVKGVISLVFLDYGGEHNKRSIVFATGKFGLKAYDITADPTRPTLVGELNMPGLRETEDTNVDPRRKLIFLARDPTAFGGDEETGESGVYIIDVADPEHVRQLAYAKVPAGHTTSCINDCSYLWTSGAGRASWMPPEWGGRPVWVTDVRNAREPKTYPDPIDTGRHDGVTDGVHDVQVDSDGVAWTSGRGGVRGYHTRGEHYDPVAKRVRRATAVDPVPYAGGGIDEAASGGSWEHNSYRPVGRTGDQAADPEKWGDGNLIYVTDEYWVANNCAAAGPLVIASLEGSYDGQGWRSTPDNKFRLRTISTWRVAGQEGSDPTTDDCAAHYFDVRDGVLVQSFYAQGTRFLDVRDPTNPRQIAYYRPANAQSYQPYWRGEYVYVADEQRGIDILRPTFRVGRLAI